MRPSFNNESGGSFVLIEPGQNGDLIVEEPFFIGARPVTQVEWSAVMGSNPSKFQEGWSAGLRPVESVSWLDCQSFIAKLNEEETEVTPDLPMDVEGWDNHDEEDIMLCSK